MKKFISLVLALVMALSLTTAAWGAVAATDAAKIGDTGYATLADAVTAANAGDEIVLLKDVADGVGIVIDKKLTIDFGGYTYTFASNPVGSTGTESQGFQILKAANAVTLKNGTLTSKANSGVKMLVNNYCNLTLDGMTLIGTNLDDATQGKYVLSNNAGDVVIEDTTITAAADGVAFDSYDYSAGGYTPPTVTVKGTSVVNGTVKAAGGKLEVEGGTINGEIAVVTGGAAADITVSGGTFAVAPPTGATLPTGMTPILTTDGTYVLGVVPTMGDKYDLYLANAGMNTALTLKTPSVAGLTFDEVGAKTNKDGSGRVAYIAANNGQYFVKTTNPTVADYAVTDAGKTTVLYYVTVAGTSAANFEYAEAVSAFTKFSTYDKCGYVTDTPAAGEDYFMAADGNVYMAAAAGTGTNYLLNGKVVSGILVGAPEDHVFTLNGYKYDTTLKQNVPTSALCTKCMMNTSSIYPIAKVPATYTLYPTNGEGSNAYTVALPSAAAVVTPSTPAGDKVESAETFDAGIAMYVGMSVMAAAGSAVVLKKKD